MTPRFPSLPPAALIAAFALLHASPALAQEEERSWILSIGAGAQVFPEYPGAEDVGIFPMPIIDLRREGDPLTFEAPDEGWGFGVLGDDSAFDFGPAVVFQQKRREEDVGAAVGDVGFTVEVGAFAELFLGDNFRLRAEGRHGLGGHEGWVGDLGADLVLRDRDNYVFSIGPRARIADDNYHDAYFSVTPAVAAATGLPAYDAGSGFHAVGAVAGLKYMLDRNWGIYGYAGYDRLIGGAADSPIVRNFGSRDQYSGGLGLFYSFSVGDLF
jgi:outer membrane protein